MDNKNYQKSMSIETAKLILREEQRKAWQQARLATPDMKPLYLTKVQAYNVILDALK